MEETKDLTVIQNKSLQVNDAAWNSLSSESKKAYSYDYKLFFEFIDKNAEDVTANDILLFVEHLEKNNYKNNSINRKIASLSKMFKIMVLSGKIKTNPVDILKQLKNVSHKVSHGINIALTIEDIKKTVENDTSNENTKKICMIIKTLASSGLRISELTGIKNKDIYSFDGQNKTITIVGKGKKERKIYFSNEFIEEIKKIYPNNDETDYLFYNNNFSRYDRRILWKQIKNRFEKKINKDVWPHLLRHFYATHKINVEKQDIKAVSLYLGHSDVSITLSAYCDTALDINNSKINI